MIIGLTGGIGSGKSTVAKLFEIMGCVTYNSDDIAKQFYFEPSIREQIIKLLGTKAYINTTTINKAFISQKVFSDITLLHQLNAIIHPEVKNHFNQFVGANPDKIVVKETALLFEAKIYKELNYSILVTAPADLRIERVMKRSGFTKQEVEERMQNQLDDTQKIPLANFVITNDSSSPLIPQVIAIIEKIRQHV